MPFLENVTRGRGIPRERLAAVAEHYLHFGGVSPINGINRALIEQICRPSIDLPVYFGNRNWEPYVEETVAAMRDNGIRRAAVFTTSAWGGYSSCTQYIEDIARGRAAAGDRAPELVKLRQYFDHPLFVEMFAEAIADAALTCPKSFATTPAGVHRALHSGCGPLPLWHGPLRPTGRVRVAARRNRGGLRRLRPGVAVAVRAATGAMAGTRCRRPSVDPRRSAAPRRSSSARSVSWPTTSRWCGIWTTSCGTGAGSPASHSPGPHPERRPPLRRLVST